MSKIYIGLRGEGVSTGTTTRTIKAKTKSGKRRIRSQKLALIINAGNPMNVAQFYRPVVIDMKGARFAKERTPIIADHDTKLRIGYTTANHVVTAGDRIVLGKGKVIEGPAIAAEGVYASSMNVAKGIIEDIKSGYPFEMSVGGYVLKSQFVDQDEVVEVNGQMHEGPIVIAREFLLKEASAVVLGADSQTSLLLASGDINMDFNEWLVAQGFEPDKLTAAQKKSMKVMFEASQTPPTPSTPPTPPAQPTPVQASQEPAPVQINAEQIQSDIRKMQAEEMKRQNALQATVNRYNDLDGLRLPLEGSEEGVSLSEFHAHAIEANMSGNDFELAVLRAARDIPPSSGPSIHVPSKDMQEGAMVASVCRSLGMVQAGENKNGRKFGLEASFSTEELEASDNSIYKDVCLHSLMDMNIRAAGQMYSGSRKSNDFIRAFNKAENILRASTAFSTLAVTNILENVAKKMMLDSWNAQDVVWDQITATKSLSDFKAHSMYRMTIDGGYQQVGAGGELKHGEFSDEKQTLQGDTYGMMLSLTRKDMINDDLDAFSSIPANLGRLAAIAIEFAVFELILDNVGTFFTSGRGNLLAGSDLDVDIAGYTAMMKLFDDQVIDDKPILLTPDRVLVGSQDRIPAAQLWQETKVDVTTTANKPQFRANPHVGALRPIVSSIMNNTNIKKMDKSAFGTQNTNQWIAMCNPAILAAWRIGFLNGNQTPVIESDDAAFNTLGRQWRSYHDWGVGEGDYQAAARSPGV